MSLRTPIRTPAARSSRNVGPASTANGVNAGSASTA